MDLGLAGKRALVIGASRGLGAAVAQRLAREGATVIAAARALPPIETWRARLETEVAARVEPAAVDLAKPDSVERLAAGLLAGAGGVDILVNNCGGPPPARALNVDDAMWVDWFRHDGGGDLPSHPLSSAADRSAMGARDHDRLVRHRPADREPCALQRGASERRGLVEDTCGRGGE